MASTSQPIRLTQEEYQLLNELISETYGLHFPPAKKEMLEARLRPRLEALRLRRFMDYYLLLRSDPDREMRELATRVTNNETYFFRETYQFGALFSEAIRELRRSGVEAGRLQILCAGCSSGEEAYTLNIYAKEDRFRSYSDCLDIHAIDIDAVRLEMARRAEYGPNALRAVNEEQIRRYFVETGPGRYQLMAGYRRDVSFAFGNIMDCSSYRRATPYDVVFCRNVLIYFSEATLFQAIRNFAQVLRPRGLLLLGHSESIIGLSNEFETVRVGNCIAYRRVGR
ncbi:MAG: protein-glutamate O-methyltransferase CheR [Gemmatimonadetes bacterium]|nr:protein-glutamate O-methyltransferase CheR [Gemmatimonadota bacterium]